MNLGAFAGGLSQGITTQQKLAQQQQEINDNRNLRTRQMAIAEAGEQRQKTQFDQDQDFKNKLDKLKADSFGPRQVPDGYTTQDDGAGNQVQVAQTKLQPATQFGEDPFATMQFIAKAAALKAVHTGDIGQLAAAMDYVDKTKATEEGKQIMAMVNGDPSQMAKYVQQNGGDPSKAKLDMDNMTLDMGNGKPPVPVKNLLAKAGSYATINVLTEDQKLALEKQRTKADIDYKGAETRRADVDANTVMPARANMLNSRAAAVGQGAKADQAVKEYAVLSKSMPLVDPTTAVPGGKPSQWSDAEQLRQSLFGQFRDQKGVNGNAAMAKANAGVQQIDSMATAGAQKVVSQLRAGNLDPKAVKDKYGGTDLATIRKTLFNAAKQQAYPNAMGLPQGGGAAVGGADPDAE